MAIYFAEVLGTISTLELTELKKEIMSLPSKIEETLKCSKEIKDFAKNIYQYKDAQEENKNHFYFVSSLLLLPL